MQLNAEINVVSLIDVMMLLMVIFMITAPIMQGGVDVTLPKAEARPLEPKSGLVVTVDRTGRIHVEDATLTFPEFRASFKACPSRALPKHFVRGKRVTVCLVYFVPRHGRLAAVAFRPTQDFNAITWRGHVFAPPKH